LFDYRIAVDILMSRSAVFGANEYLMTISANQAMDHPIRKRIIAFLMLNKGRRASFVLLRRVLGGIHQASVAHHCKILVQLGFIEVRRYRRPRRSIYRLKMRGAIRGSAWVAGISIERPPP